jgi:hypothetical protein
VRAAIDLRRSAEGRSLLIEPLVAGCALANVMELVHRDSRMDRLSGKNPQIVPLPTKT